ncbi:MAG TPA: CoA-transferase [Myxococcota bacterium]|nr:hypothetical protein [Myxococcota bacterium]HNZ02879.1 CoA-transferase [Myxococcota bacterium]HOD07905.1 CoA-transferase [Myxococcota bacterium]
MAGLLSKLSVYKRVLTWALNKNKIDIDYKPKVDNPKFKTGLEAAAMIPDGAIVSGCGMASNVRPASVYRAVRQSFQNTGHPANLTWINAGGTGLRGRAPGGTEEVCVSGLLTHYISGHHETVRAGLELVAKGDMYLTVYPQGTLIHLIEAQGHGQYELVTEVGVGTFVDPRVGTGTQVETGRGEQMVSVEGDMLKYTLPKINVSVVAATYADEDGNIYMKDSPMYTEVRESTLAAKYNGGLTIVNVAGIIPRDDSQIFIPADKVDAIVVNRYAEQCLMFPQKKPLMALTLSEKMKDIPKFLDELALFNRILKLDPVRSPLEYMLARQTAKLFMKVGFPGVRTIIGYGLPQEVGGMANRGGMGSDITYLIETGVVGGVPVPGFFFGMAINPEKLISSAEMFHFIEDNLDVVILGMLQVDPQGNVNVSRKSKNVKEYVGPGGFINLVTYAKNIIFIGQWTAKAEVEIVDGKLDVKKRGIPKFVRELEEITFNARAALSRGQKVFYCTTAGTFRLTERGLELIQVAPGLDIQKDIIDVAPWANIVLPENGQVDVLDRSVMTGDGFKLAWENKD